MSTGKEAILNGEAVLGIELGSTRIKAVLVDGTNQPIGISRKRPFRSHILRFSRNDGRPPYDNGI